MQTLVGLLQSHNQNFLLQSQIQRSIAVAAIDLSKLGTTTADRALITSGTGAIEVSAVTSTEIGILR